jgi:hypothetical protein
MLLGAQGCAVPGGRHAAAGAAACAGPGRAVAGGVRWGVRSVGAGWVVRVEALHCRVSVGGRRDARAAAARAECGWVGVSA